MIPRLVVVDSTKIIGFFCIFFYEDFIEKSGSVYTKLHLYRDEDMMIHSGTHIQP